jgi:ATP-dependent protease Clp ATPase subunit
MTETGSEIRAGKSVDSSGGQIAAPLVLSVGAKGTHEKANANQLGAARRARQTQSLCRLDARFSDTGRDAGSPQPEDLLKYGLIPEFVGRLPVIAT